MLIVVSSNPRIHRDVLQEVHPGQHLDGTAEQQGGHVHEELRGPVHGFEFGGVAALGDDEGATVRALVLEKDCGRRELLFLRGLIRNEEAGLQSQLTACTTWKYFSKGSSH